MVLNKADLLKILKSLGVYDASASPYIAVQMTEGELPRFYRSSNYGQIQDLNFDLMKTGNTYVSLSHFKLCLSALADANVELSIGANGILTIASTDNSFASEIPVHTVPSTQAGLKAHDVGPVKIQLPATTFAGCDFSKFAAASPCMLLEGRLMVATKFGVVVWDGPAILRSIELQPREAFLELVSSPVDELFITEKAYWGTRVGNLLTMTHGHALGREFFNTYNVPGIELAKLPAQRLIQALYTVSDLTGDQDKIEIVPKDGILAKDKFGSTARFSLGGAEGWTRFSIFGKTAKTIADALSQARGSEEVILYDVPSFSSPTKRLRADPWETNFRTL